MEILRVTVSLIFYFNLIIDLSKFDIRLYRIERIKFARSSLDFEITSHLNSKKQGSPL